MVENVDPTTQERASVDQIVEQSKLQRIDVNHTPWNCGYAHAVNVGFGKLHTKGARDILLACNADVEVLSADALDMCCETLESNKLYSILGPRQVDDRGRITHAGIAGTATSKRLIGWRASRGYEETDDTMASVSGSIYFIRGRVWDELSDCFQQNPEGAFLLTPHYYEETFCSDHATAHGYKVVYYGERTFLHRWHRASPVGGPADSQIKASRDLYRAACQELGIEYE
jgi:GT2 family glycosyltransferase